MKKFSKVIAIVLALTLVCGMFAGCVADEAKYPDRDITFVIPFGQGGGVDTWGRKVAEGLSKELGVNVTANNVTGGSAGSIGVVSVWDAEHDGFTLCGTSETPLTIPVMTPISQTAKDWEYFIAAGSPGLLCMNAKKAEKLGIKNIQDLSNYAKKSDLKIAGTTGGLWFALSSLLTSEKYGNWPLTWVSYNGSGPAILAAMGGTDADLVATSAGEVADYLRSGDLIALANMDAQAYKDVPSITTVLPELGKYFPLRQWLGFMVPSDTDPEILKVLAAAFEKVMKTEDVKAFAESQAAEIFAKVGEDAKAMAQASEKSLCWILYDLGQTTFSPADRGIAKP